MVDDDGLDLDFLAVAGITTAGRLDALGLVPLVLVVVGFFACDASDWPRWPMDKEGKQAASM